MRKLLLTFFAAFLVLVPFSSQAKPAATNLFNVLSYFGREAGWSKSPNAFIIENRPYGFRFLDAERTTAFSPEQGRMVFGKFEVYETRVYWKGGTIRRVEVSIYNKGDAKKPISKEKFETSVADLTAFLTHALGAPEKAPDSHPAPHKIVKQSNWKRKAPLFQLEWAYVEPYHDKGSGFRIPYQPEYIRIVMVPKTGRAAVDNANLTGQSMLVRAKSLLQLKENLVRNSKGDVAIENIPMVDQGQKGYCAAASAERIIRYFGIDVDQHQIAQLAETSARFGTSIGGITDAIATIGKKYSLDKKILISPDTGRSFQDSQLFQDLKVYNSVARRLGKPEVDWKRYMHNHMIDIGAIWRAIDPELLMQSRLRHKQDFIRFITGIRAHVDMGIPLCWACMVGMYPEVPDIDSEGVFGHIRLIIGYNTKTREILYSDTWGADHALKRMPEEQAWAMTTALLVLKPRL